MVGEVVILPLWLNGPQAFSEGDGPLTAVTRLVPNCARELTNLVSCTAAQASQHCMLLGFLQTTTLVTIQRTESLYCYEQGLP